MKLIKLTKRDNTTYNGCKWGKNVTHEVRDKGKELCTSQVIHAYRSLPLALLLNPIHGNHIPCNIWEADGEVITEDWGEVGVHKLTTTKKLIQPSWYRNKITCKKVQIQFAILCAKAVLKYFEKKYPKDNRPRKAIEAAESYLKDGSKAAHTVAYAAHTAAYAADAATDAAYAAAYAAYAAADAVAHTAAHTAHTAHTAAYAAAYAAHTAADAVTGAELNFNKLAEKAIGIIMD